MLIVSEKYIPFMGLWEFLYSRGLVRREALIASWGGVGE
jgi:hypothetical protein